MSQLEILRNLLLVSLLAMLIYIMYKRLIHLMQKQNTQAKYPALDADCTWDGAMIYLGMTIEKSMHIQVRVLGGDNQIIQEIYVGEVIAGHHNYGLETSKLSAGKYHFEIITPHEKALRFFQIA